MRIKLVARPFLWYGIYLSMAFLGEERLIRVNHFCFLGKHKYKDVFGYRPILMSMGFGGRGFEGLFNQ